MPSDLKMHGERDVMVWVSGRVEGVVCRETEDGIYWGAGSNKGHIIERRWVGSKV